MKLNWHRLADGLKFRSMESGICGQQRGQKKYSEEDLDYCIARLNSPRTVSFHKSVGKTRFRCVLFRFIEQEVQLNDPLVDERGLSKFYFGITLNSTSVLCGDPTSHPSVSWNQASELCQIISGHLPLFRSRSELDEFILVLQYNWMSEIKISPKQIRLLFIGLKATENKVGMMLCLMECQ